MIIDTADDTRHVLDKLKAAGVTAIIRYYSSSSWKRVLAPEARAIAEAGLVMGAVYEDAGATPSAFTVSNAHAHAMRALAQAAEVGQPDGSAIYFAVDFDPTEGQISGHIIPYFKAVSNTLGGKYRLGAYASGACCDALLLQFPRLLPWITCSLGFNGTRVFLTRDRHALYQGTFDGHGNPHSGCDKTLYGLSVDYNTAHVQDWGQFTPFGSTQPPGPTIVVHDTPWLQRALVPYGYTGAIDGIIGPGSIAAMIKYVESKGE